MIAFSSNGLGAAAYGTLAWAQEQSMLSGRGMTPVTAAGVSTSTYGDPLLTPAPTPVIQVVGPEPAQGATYVPMPTASLNTVQCDHLASVLPASWPAGQPINRQTVDAYFLQLYGKTLTEAAQIAGIKPEFKAINDCLTAQESAAASGGTSTAGTDKTMLYVGIVAAMFVLIMLVKK